MLLLDQNEWDSGFKKCKNIVYIYSRKPQPGMGSPPTAALEHQISEIRTNDDERGEGEGVGANSDGIK